MSLKTTTILVTAFTFFAFEAHAQVKDASTPENDSPKNCVMYSGELDQNCDGIADVPPSKATDYNSSRSNKSYSVLDSEPDDGTQDQDANGAVSATDYNSSRSNKADGVIEDGSGDGAPDTDDEEDSKATDYNSSRSNKSF